MIVDNILRWYIDNVIRERYGIEKWPIVEKHIKEDKIKLIFEIENIKMTLEIKELTNTKIIFNHFVCGEFGPPTYKVKGVEYELKHYDWVDSFEETINSQSTSMESMSIFDIQVVAGNVVESVIEKLIKEKNK